ncbi:hypothetical protein DFH09DRAFT_1166215, partial [Mycena vulgaris]
RLAPNSLPHSPRPCNTLPKPGARLSRAHAPHRRRSRRQYTATHTGTGEISKQRCKCKTGPSIHVAPLPAPRVGSVGWYTPAPESSRGHDGEGRPNDAPAGSARAREQGRFLPVSSSPRKAASKTGVVSARAMQGRAGGLRSRPHTQGSLVRDANVTTRLPACPSWSSFEWVAIWEQDPGRPSIWGVRVSVGTKTRRK